jgi:L-asparagine oxygenase
MLIELEQKEIKTLCQAALQITHDPILEPDLFCREVKSLAAHISPRILKKLLDFKRNGSETGFLLFNLGETVNENIVWRPEFSISPIISHFVSAILLSSISDLVAYEAESGGKLFQEIIPVPHMSNAQTSLGSNVELEIHTEQAFSDLRPDILSLTCIRGDPSAITYIFSVEHILENFTSEECEFLRKPLWKTGVDLSFKLHGVNQFINGDIRGPMPILYGSKKDPFLRFDQDLMFGITEEAQQMLKKIVDVYHSKKIAHVLKPGEIIFVDNRRALHGRSPFFPKYDGNDRFLIRCFSTFDYSKFSDAIDERMVKAIYS